MKSRLRRDIIINRVVIIACVAFFALVFLFPSVINMRPQIQTKLLITAIGLDKSEDGRIELSGIAVMPTAGTDTASVHSITVEHKADTIGKNLEGLSEIYGRQIELGLCGLVVMGENMTEGVEEHFEFLISSGYLSPGAYLTHAPNAKAKDVLSLASKLNPSSAEILSSVVDFNANSNNISTITLLQFVSQTNSISASSAVPQIVFDKSKDEKSGEESKNSTQGEGSPSSKSSEQGKESMKTAIKSLTETALFANGKKVGEFDGNQTLAYDLTRGDATQGSFVLENFSIDGESLGAVECQIYGKSFSQKSEFVDGVPTLTYYPQITLQLIDQHRIIRKWREMGMDENAVTKPLLEQFGNKVKSDLLSAIQKSKACGADVFLIEDEFYRKNHKEYKEYKKTHPEFLSEVQVEIRPKIKFK